MIQSLNQTHLWTLLHFDTRAFGDTLYPKYNIIVLNIKCKCYIEECSLRLLFPGKGSSVLLLSPMKHNLNLQLSEAEDEALHIVKNVMYFLFLFSFFLLSRYEQWRLDLTCFSRLEEWLAPSESCKPGGWVILLDCGQHGPLFMFSVLPFLRGSVCSCFLLEMADESGFISGR